MQNLYRSVAILAIGLLAAATACQESQRDAEAQAPPLLESKEDKLSYALGADIGRDLRDQSVDVTPELLVRGIHDALSGGEMLMSEEEAQATVASLRRELRQQLAAAAEKRGEENLREGIEFLAANKKEEGVIALESGLQYRILEQGDGPKPSASDIIECHYRGTLIDGTQFDSSYERGKPAVFPVRKLIAGWEQALLMMPVGSKWQIFVPPELGYGKRGSGRTIGPNSTLIFEIELLGIRDARTVAAGQRTSDSPAMQREHEGPGTEPLASLSGIHVSFKLDPRLTKGLYMGDRWVSPPTYTTTLGTVEVRAEGFDAGGRPVEVRPRWTPADPDMVQVSPAEGDATQITVKRAGQTTVEAASGGVSRTLYITASRLEGDTLRVQIGQRP